MLNYVVLTVTVFVTSIPVFAAEPGPSADHCYLSASLSRPTTLSIGPSYEKSVRRLEFTANSFASILVMTAILRTLQDEGICSKDANPGTCYVEPGISFTGISIRDAGKEDRNIIYDLRGLNWLDIQTILSWFKNAGVCSSVSERLGAR